MPTPTPRYDRTPSEELLTLLRPGGFLSPLIDLTERKVRGLELDVHLRRDDEIHVYCGLTRVLTAKRLWNGHVNLKAHKTYTEQQCGEGLFRHWRTDEQEFKEMLDHYLSGVEVAPRWTKGEGAIQIQWSRVRSPWIPFDREAVLAYKSIAHRERVKSFSEVEAALATLMDIYQDPRNRTWRDQWAKPSKGGKELDQLAVDPAGRLVLIELKDGSKRSFEVYYAPFQLLQYVWEWHAALGAVWSDLQKLIGARVALGLAPQDAPRLNGGIRAVVGFGRDTRSDEVKRRYRKVLDVANEHLPPGVGPIETWEITDTGPRRLYCTKTE